MRAQAFVIHLARAVRRRPQVDALLARLPLPAAVIDAVDGQAFNHGEIAAVYRPNLHRPRYPFPLLPTEVAVFLSHRKAWRLILDEGLEAGLIVEDDVEPEDGAFGEALALALAHAGQGDYVRFPYRGHTDEGAVLAWQGAHRLVEPRHAGLGMQMQLVTRDAAYRLLRATEHFDRPVDALVQMRWLTGVRILALRPGSIRQIAERLGGTVTQQKDKPFGEVVAREVKRAAYRLVLRLRDRGGRG